eukprot:5873766-Pyramimonas_sp.AAC.1
MLVFSGFEGGLLFTLTSLCWLPAAFIQMAGLMVHFACIACGLAQGCPSSGSLWAIIMNPFIHHMQRCTDRSSYSALGACADDVGAVLRSRRLLLGMWRAFEAARVLAGLRLKLAKCVLIPLDGPVTEESKQELT